MSNYRVIDPGHHYEVPHRTVQKPCGKSRNSTAVRFLKRRCETAPHEQELSGPITQDYIRVLIDRVNYLNAQQPCLESDMTINALKTALYWMERRAWARHVLGVDGKAADHSEADKFVPPFTVHTVLDLPIGDDGHVITETAP